MPTYTGNIFDAVAVYNIEDDSPAQTTVINSDSTFSTTVTSGQRLLLPDTNIENSLGAVILEAPSCVTSTLSDKAIRNSAGTQIGTAVQGIENTVSDITLTNYDGSTSTKAAGVDIVSTQLPRGYAHPVFTGQTTVNQAGDAAWVKANYFSSLSKGYVVPLSSFFVLAENNIFGNTNRFTGINGNQTFTDNYLIDNYTGLGWYVVPIAPAVWATQIALYGTFTHTVNSVTYSDFFVANKNQLMSLFNTEVASTSGSHLGYAPFNIASITIWTSDTVPLTSNSYRVQTSTGIMESRAKTESYRVLMCRKHL